MPLPTNTQLMLPLLHTLRDRGGAARPRDVYADIADQLGVSSEDRSATVTIGGRKVNAFERRVRWTRQTAVLSGLIAKERSGIWNLTDAANSKLGNMVRGTVLTFAISSQGAFLWANAEDAVGVLEEGSVQLVLTSPPYPLLNPKSYGNIRPDLWVGWMLELCAKWAKLLTEDGSMILNIGHCWNRGVPTQQLHIERLLVKLEDELGVHLLQHLYWHSPTKMPSPLKWVGIERMRVTPSVEPLLWLSPNPMAYGNNSHLLREYTPGGRKAIAKPRLNKRPSGFSFGHNSFRDVGGSIPPSLFVATPTSKHDVRYRKAERAAGREPHPAVMPAPVARSAILLTTDPGDIVYDPCCGSGQTVAQAIDLGRIGIGSERALTFLESSNIRCKTMGIEMQQMLSPH